MSQRPYPVTQEPFAGTVQTSETTNAITKFTFVTLSGTEVQAYPTSGSSQRVAQYTEPVGVVQEASPTTDTTVPCIFQRGLTKVIAGTGGVAVGDECVVEVHTGRALSLREATLAGTSGAATGSWLVGKCVMAGGAGAVCVIDLNIRRASPEHLATRTADGTIVQGDPVEVDDAVFPDVNIINEADDAAAQQKPIFGVLVGTANAADDEECDIATGGVAWLLAGTGGLTAGDDWSALDGGGATNDGTLLDGDYVGGRVLTTATATNYALVTVEPRRNEIA